MLPFKARILARTILPNRRWFPIEAWDDERYDAAFARMKAQPDDLEAQRVASADATGPTFSIVVPLFRTPREFLADMAESVLAQTYPRFELILVNASPDLPDLKAWVDEYAARDERVKVVQLEGNFGITENTNRGIGAATGDFLCFMDHDDWIEPDALFEMAAAVRAHEDVDLLYCDEDLVEKAAGKWRFQHPLFKPDFSPELLLCKNFVVHLLTVRKSLVDAMSAPGSEFDGAQDYNMTFAIAEQARFIHHVPKVLYHWRMSEGSTAANSAAKPYGKRAYRLSAQRHLERTGSTGRIIGTGIVNIHNIWFRPDGSTRVSVVVAQPEGAASASFGAFLESFAQVNAYPNVEVVVVGPAEALDATCSRNGSGHGVAGARFVETAAGSSLAERFNAGAQAATGDALVFLDAECQFVTPEPIEQLVGLLEREGVGVVAPKVLYADYVVKSYGVGVSGKGVMPLYRGYPLDHPSYQCNMRAFQNVSAVGYQGLAVMRGAFAQLGGFDARFTGELAAVDLCTRMAAGGARVVAACTVELLTADMAPLHSFGAGEAFGDFPPSEIEALYGKHPSLRDADDRFRSPHLDLRTGYPAISPDWLSEKRTREGA